ncbi:LapA family protein [Coprobacter sp.]
MTHLLLSTLEMIALTFLIGFFVAGVIKFIAVWADSMDFYNSHQEEILRLKRLRKLHQKVAKLVEQEAMESCKFYGDKRNEFSKGVNGDPADVRKAGYYHGVSHGASKMDLLDYYYPEDIQIMYLKKEERYKRKSEDRFDKKGDSREKR